MGKTAARLVIGCALTGLVASTAAAYVHYRLLSDPSYLSFCDVGGIVSCTQVYSSRFGSVGGISVAVLGAIWFGLATLLAIAAAVGPPGVRENAAGYLFVGSTLALGEVLYLAYASFVLLSMVCVLCLVTYAAAIGLFLIAGAAASMPLLSLPRRALGDLKLLVSSPVAVALSLLFVAGAVSTLILFPRSPTSLRAETADVVPDERAQFEQWYTAQPRRSLDVSAEGAQVLVIKFNDYQCPPCRETYMQYRDVFAKYASTNPGAVHLVLRDFPLESECNAGVTGDLHPAACEAAVAVRLAREQGRGELVEQWLFENQPALTPEVVAEVAAKVGQVKDFSARYQPTLEAVKADIAQGRLLGVRATPTFFVNGVMIQGGLPPQFFDQAIAYELQRASAQ
jgi:uncharacterized membrane protein/protein-disulfide isomerase